MDPLSVAASIAGLLSAAKEVSSIIRRIASSRKTGIREINEILITVQILRSVLLHLQLLLCSPSVISAAGSSLIMVEEVVVTLSGCVMTFSDLDGCIRDLDTEDRLGFLDSARWATRTPELKKYLDKLESHKSSLGLILNILTW